MAENDDYDGIEEKFLDVGDLFGLQFSDGLIFLEVTGVETNKYQPYDQIDEIPPDDNVGFQRLEDPTGDDILHIPDTETKVIHAAIGQTPAEVRRYTNYPESQTRLRTPPNLTVPRATSGDPYGHIDGSDSPYDKPTDAQELMIPPLVHLDFAFYNPDQNRGHQPLLNIKFREYNVRPFDPSENVQAVRNIMRPGSPIPIYPVGSIDQQDSMSGKLSSSWGVDPMSRSRVMRVISNE